MGTSVWSLFAVDKTRTECLVKNFLCLSWLVVQQALHFLFWERECAPLSFVCDDAVLQGGRLWWFKVKNITAYTFLKNCHHQKKVFAIGIQQIVERKKLSRGFFWLIRMSWQCMLSSSHLLPFHYLHLTLILNFSCKRRHDACFGWGDDKAGKLDKSLVVWPAK